MHKVTTVCSGTDSPILALQGLIGVVETASGISMTLDHMSSCDIDPKKAKFIGVAFPGVPVFKNAADLVKDFAPVHNSAQNDKGHIVRLGNVLFAGFPCTSASTLNPRSSTDHNRSCCASGSLATGSVYTFIHDMIREHGDGELVFVIFENVSALLNKSPDSDQSNFDHVACTMEALGFFVHAFLLDPRQFGQPQSRKRIWILCIKRSLLQSCSENHDRFHDLLDRAMTCFIGSKLTPLDDILLAEDDEWLASARALTRKVVANTRGSHEGVILATHGCPGETLLKSRARKFENDIPAWWKLHSEAFSKSGTSRADLPQFTDDDIAAFPYLGILTARQLEELHLQGVRDFPERIQRVLDISQCLSRSTPSLGHSPVVTPHAELYLSCRCRSIHPVEQFRLQGIYFPDEVLGGFRNDLQLLSSLAGNAFEVSCCVAVILSAWVAVSSGSSAARALVSSDPDSELSNSEHSSEESLGDLVWKRARK